VPIQRIQLRQDGEHQRAAADLGVYLAAHLALERASTRRSFAVHVAALLGIPAVLCNVLSASRDARELVLGLFALGACSAVAALGLELRCARALRRAERGVRVTRGGG